MKGKINMNLNSGTMNRVSHEVYFPEKKLREEFINTIHSLKMTTGKPIYVVIAEALEMYKQNIKDKRK